MPIVILLFPLLVMMDQARESMRICSYLELGKLGATLFSSRGRKTGSVGKSLVFSGGKK